MRKSGRNYLSDVRQPMTLLITARAPLSGHLVAQALTPDDPLFQPRTESVLMLPASNSAGSSSGWPATSWNPAAGIGSWTRQPGAPSPTLTPGPGCASSDRTARLRWVRLFFVDGPRGFCQRHGKSYLTRRRRGGEGGGGGLLTGRAIPSAYRWAWCRWNYSRRSLTFPSVHIKLEISILTSQYAEI